MVGYPGITLCFVELLNKDLGCLGERMARTAQTCERLPNLGLLGALRWLLAVVGIGANVGIGISVGGCHLPSPRPVPPLPQR